MTEKEKLSQIESLLERWLFGRDSDIETLESIKQLMLDEGYLEFFKEY